MAWYKSGWNISGNVLKCQEAQPPNPGRTQHMHPHARATSCPWCLHDDFKKKKWFSLHPDASVTHHLEMIHYATMCWLRHLVDLFGTNYSHFRRFLQKKWSASQPQIYQEMINSHYQSYLRLNCRLQRCYNPFRYWWFSNISYYRDETMIIVCALESWKIWELFTSHHPLIPNRLDVSGSNQTLQGFTNRGATGWNPFLQGFSLAKASSVSCGHPDSNGAVFFMMRFSVTLITMLYHVHVHHAYGMFMFTMFRHIHVQHVSCSPCL